MASSAPIQEALKQAIRINLTMAVYLGLDTSNYTTSAALFDTNSASVTQSKRLLPVKEGELGLRQSDAVFHHVKQLPQIIEGLNIAESGIEFSGVGVSNRPRNVDGSYMPCFLVGETVAHTVSSLNGIPLYKTSHQVGHILAALFSCRRLDLVFGDKPFLAFHVSGGTTDCLIVTPDKEDVIKVSEAATSLDIKAGQLIDRAGLMFGLKFPCGVELEKLAMESDRKYKFNVKLKDGCCCLSGIENKCRDMLSSGEKPCDIALYAIKYIEAVIHKMTEYAFEKYGNMPVVYAGGVMSDMLIRASLARDFDAYFSEPCFSCDNAVGTAIYAAIKDGFTP